MDTKRATQGRGAYLTLFWFFDTYDIPQQQQFQNKSARDNHKIRFKWIAKNEMIDLVR